MSAQAVLRVSSRAQAASAAQLALDASHANAGSAQWPSRTAHNLHPASQVASRDTPITSLAALPQHAASPWLLDAPHRPAMPRFTTTVVHELQWCLSSRQHLRAAWSTRHAVASQRHRRCAGPADNWLACHLLSLKASQIASRALTCSHTSQRSAAVLTPLGSSTAPSPCILWVADAVKKCVSGQLHLAQLCLCKLWSLQTA